MDFEEEQNNALIDATIRRLTKVSDKGEQVDLKDIETEFVRYSEAMGFQERTMASPKLPTARVNGTSFVKKSDDPTGLSCCKKRQRLLEQRVQAGEVNNNPGTPGYPISKVSSSRGWQFSPLVHLRFIRLGLLHTLCEKQHRGPQSRKLGHLRGPGDTFSTKSHHLSTWVLKDPKNVCKGVLKGSPFGTKKRSLVPANHQCGNLREASCRRPSFWSFPAKRADCGRALLHTSIHL